MHGLRAELRGIQAVAFDLDGVLYQANAPIPGAARTVQAVRGAGRGACANGQVPLARSRWSHSA